MRWRDLRFMRTPPRLRRRTFLELLSAALVPAACAAPRPADDEEPEIKPPQVDPASARRDANIDAVSFDQSPFLLGVASGDPQHDRVLLWTRLVAQPIPTKEGARLFNELPPNIGDIIVEWIVALDPALVNIVQRGAVVARSAQGHAVRVDVTDLTPSTTYHYAFRLGPHISTIGRTKTLPAPGAPVEKIRFAIAACQNWQEGYYTAHSHLAEEDLDFVLFLGDYIYEEGVRKDAVRPHEAGRPETLEEYRRRHALYKSDRDLQKAHAAHPWITIWDDHEVAGNYAAEFPTELPIPSPKFLEQRAAAYEAYWEHMPVRSSAPSGPNMQLFRQFTIGSLARLVMLDGRQYRSKPPCEGKVMTGCDARTDPKLSMLGEAQENWLFDALHSSTERWKLVGNNTIMSPAVVLGSLANTDQWDGFAASRQRVLDAFKKIEGQLVVMTGDIHATVLSELPSNANDPSSSKVGVEIVTTAMSSTGVHGLLDMIAKAVAGLTHMKYLNAKDRGYLLCELTHERLAVALRGVSGSLKEPTAKLNVSPIKTIASWTIEHGSSHIETRSV
jgi:alkaline phosphatase D